MEDWIRVFHGTSCKENYNMTDGRSGVRKEEFVFKTISNWKTCFWSPDFPTDVMGIKYTS